jgi:FtsP/CotA-like multicopper oxidase with cupredoxin domain
VTTFQITEDSKFLVDGQPFDPNRVDAGATGCHRRVGDPHESTEWHPFHIHVNDYQVMAINDESVAVPTHEDTTPLPPHGSITIRTRSRDFTGSFPYHCHILGHDDAGMMALVEVTDGGTAPTPTPEQVPDHQHP